MAAVVPFIASEGRYQFSTDLDDTPYIFDVHWNARAGSWYFDLLTEGETPIASGVRVVLGALLAARASSDDRPRGALIAVDLTGQGEEATFDDLGERVVVYYYTEDEVNAL